ncbi:MAG: amidohydrolase [Candidatus Bathyarchaeota archaeon]|nr:MAG: amidohydrolase [Candidatus Bathyarchaeota archaeon]
MNPEQPKAQALAIKHGKFVAVGTEKEILPYIGKNTEKIDLEGKSVVPGFIDTHVHGASLGKGLSQINLRYVKSIKEIQKKVKQRSQEIPEDNWIIGRGWDQDKLAEKRYPQCSDLDQAVPNQPVFLLRVCGHLGIINSKAMKLVGLTKETKPPKGGVIDKNPKTHEPNGILREHALKLVYKHLPKTGMETLKQYCLLACQVMAKNGITTAHWITNSVNEIQALQELKKSDLLPLRIYLLISVESLDRFIETGLSTGFGDDKIKIGSVKILTDGSLGGRTAALDKPYNDAPETKGILLHSQRQLERYMTRAHEAGFQLAIHTIGDKTVRTVLRILNKVLQKIPRINHRHRLEHVSVLNPKLMKKIKEIGAIASVQPHFVISDFWIEKRLGKTRARWTYAFKSILNQGIMTMGGSDAPVEPVSPILGIYAAVARKTIPQERLTLDEALRLYTVNAAYGSFEEDVKGSIQPDKFADLVVLSQDPYKTTYEQVKNLKVEMTIVGGKIVYTREQ